MGYAEAAEALVRRRLLEEMYDRMTDDEKKLFVQMVMQQKSSDEIMKALQRQSAQIEDLRRRQQTFGEDFASNIAGNLVYGGIVWLASRLLGK